jgi:tRNA(Ile)-lysidine synthase TilS/MesJ
VVGLFDQREEGTNRIFTRDIQNYVKGMLQINRSIPSSEVKNVIANEFNKLISETVINDFRRENNLTWIHPNINKEIWQKSGAAEIIIALALKSGYIDTIAQFIYTFAQNLKEIDKYQNSELIEKDLVELRSNGKFTADYNKEEKVRTSKFNSIDEKGRIPNKKVHSSHPRLIANYSLLNDVPFSSLQVTS